MENNSEDLFVALLSEHLALERGFTAAYVRKIRTAALLHDIGKQKLSKALLNKPGKLNADEFETIKTHTTIGAQMMSGIHGDIGEMIVNVCAYHHEWYNTEFGGYWGLRADDLPPYIPIVSISDTFAALIYARPYKSAWAWGDAQKYIQRQSGIQFNPALVRDFISIITKLNFKGAWY